MSETMTDKRLAELRRIAETARHDPYAVVATGNEVLTLLDRIDAMEARPARGTPRGTPTSDERLAELRADVAAGVPLYPTSAADLIAEVERQRSALARVTDDSMAERLTDALVMTRLSDHAGTDMRLIDEAAAKVLAVIRAIAGEHLGDEA